MPLKLVMYLLYLHSLFADQFTFTKAKLMHYLHPTCIQRYAVLSVPPCLFLFPLFSVPEIVNGPLTGGSTYQFLQRGLDKQRDIIETGEWTPVLKPLPEPTESTEPTEPPPVAVIVSVVVVVTLVIVIVSAVLLYLRRRNIGGREKPLGKYVLTQS